MLWADPTDLAVYRQVTGHMDATTVDPELASSVATALAVASEVLTLATAYLIHPAGTSTEEFIGSPHVRRFSPVYGPVSHVASVLVVDTAGTTSPVNRPWQLVGGTIHFRDRTNGVVPWRTYASGASSWRAGNACEGPEQVVYRVTYDFASTLSRGAFDAVLQYAHQLWLAAEGDDECQLPERVATVSREGIEMSMLTPSDYMDKGKVGLPRVDTWLALVNPKQARRPSAVYTPDSPPGVNTRLARRP